MKQTRVSCLLIVLFLTGCWDQRVLKDTVFMSTVAYEKTGDNQIQETVSVHSYVTKENQPINKVFTVTGGSPRQGRMELNQQISGSLMSAKVRVILVQDELAREGMLEISDVLYRTPESPLSAKYAIVQGSPSEIINLQRVGEELIGEYLSGIVRTAEQSSAVPIETIQTICTVLFDPGKGLALPYLRLNEQNQSADIIGTALFDGDQFSGVTLNTVQSAMLLLLADRKAKYMMMSDYVTVDGQKNVVSYDIIGSKSKLKIKMDSVNIISVTVPTKVKVEISEFTHNQLTQKKVKKVEKKLEAILQKRAENVVNKLQEANCDFLEIGRELMAYYPKEWKQLDWKKDYGEISIKPEVSVEIIHKGVIN
ncbi:Ger(x)C family spore germination protein [Bacillus sp. CGMCC 1.16541]|uniref:Ger(x)C family spore germination protein n=1 Tax=Bacillus sp. CGMCC 1.16541 TaxID=2185143 RepID=UPI0013A5892A|nr:Ger(x)C family spore germination protein [Bacillus sp. CGMCC 1.16541]